MQEEIFYHLIFKLQTFRARRIVENAFGTFASRFRIFRRPISLSPDKTILLVKAACALHNWIRKTGNSSNFIPVDIEDTETGCLIEGSRRNDPKPSGLLDLTPIQMNYATDAKLKRNYLADYFVGDGTVYWQNRMIE